MPPRGGTSSYYLKLRFLAGWHPCCRLFSICVYLDLSERASADSWVSCKENFPDDGGILNFNALSDRHLRP